MLNHADLHELDHAFEDKTPADWCQFVGVGREDTAEYMKVIRDNLSGNLESSFTIAAVDKDAGQISGYVRCTRHAGQKTISHIKVDEPHEGRGLGTLLIDAAEACALKKGWSAERTDLSVHRKNKRAQACYEKSHFVADEVGAEAVWRRMTRRRTA